ncbi:MAG: hypothetical protein RSA90_03560 [Lachnospiraceae bacterium]
MDKKNMKPMTPFDTLITTSGFETIKLLLPYMPSANQPFLGVYIKFLELQHTIDYFKDFKSDLHTQALDKELTNPLDFIEEMTPYLKEEDSAMLHMLFTLLNTSDTSNPADAMLHMLSPEQQGLFQMYNNMFNQDMKGDDTDERMDEPPCHEEY